MMRIARKRRKHSDGQGVSCIAGQHDEQLPCMPRLGKQTGAKMKPTRLEQKLLCEQAR